MHQIFYILKYKIIIGMKMKLEYRWNIILKNLASLIIFTGFLIVLYFFILQLITYFVGELHAGIFVLNRFFSIYLFILLTTFCLANVLVLHATLFKSSEVRFLIAHPISYFKIYLIKFFDNFIYTSVTFFIIGVAIIAGYGTYFGFPWFMYPLLIIGILIPYMLLTACIAAIILFIGVRVTEFISIRTMAAILVTGYIGVVIFFIWSVSPMALLNRAFIEYSLIDNYLANFDPWFLQYLPSHWIMEALYWIAQKHYGNALFYIGQLLALVGLLFGVAAVIGRRYFYSSWLVSMEDRKVGPSTRRNSTSRLIDLSGSSILPRPISVLIKRDVLRFFRDTAQWVHMLLFFLVFAVFLFNITKIEINIHDPFLMTVLYLILFIFNALIIAIITLRFVYPAMSMEGEALWIIRSAPIHIQWIFFLKGTFAGAGLTGVALLFAFLTISALFSKSSLLWFTFITQFLTVLTIVGINLSLGSCFAQFNEKNSVRVASSQGASLTFLIVLVYLLMSVSIYIPFLAGYFERLALFSVHTLTWMKTPLLLSTTITVFFLGLSTTLGLKALRGDV
jgi:ABC-2 type transport system permease protein